MKMASIIFLGTIHVLALCGCSTMQPVDTNISKEGLKDSITAGDEIVIYTKPHGFNFEEKHKVVVKAIMEEKIIAEDTDQNELEFYFRDIKTIEKYQYDAGKTSMTVMTVSHVGQATVYIIFLSLLIL